MKTLTWLKQPEPNLVEKGFNQIKKIGLFIEHYGYFKGHMHVYYCY